MSAPVVLVFDSGLGGLTVYREIRKAAPGARFVYLADDAVFPYGGLAPEALIARVNALMDVAIARHAPDVAVIACNTASTLVLPHLRARHAIPFVGTVPAIKPAAAASRSRMISVLATPGTVARDYTRDLARTYAGDCQVQLVGSRRLAALAEQAMAGEAVADADIAVEISPCFQTAADGVRQTDAVALACTHYPLLLERFIALAPWPVSWIDPAPAIARRTRHLLGEAGFAPDVLAATNGVEAARAVFTAGSRLGPPLRAWLAALGVAEVAVDPMAPWDSGAGLASGSPAPVDSGATGRLPA